MKPILDVFVTKQISAAYRAGYKKCLEDRGELSRFISRNQADKTYGRMLIQHLLDAGIIEMKKIGEKQNCKNLIDRERLEMVISANEIQPKPEIRCKRKSKSTQS